MRCFAPTSIAGEALVARLPIFDRPDSWVQPQCGDLGSFAPVPVRTIILKLAQDGERDPVRLRTGAFTGIVAARRQAPTPESSPWPGAVKSRRPRAEL
jgi:hypothetical protein